MPSVSIIIPCYNEQDTIRLLLEAIDQQTYPSNDMEIVIADGFSKDNTRGEIATFQSAHPDLRISVIENVGRTIPSALNAAIQASSGDYIVRLDAHSIPVKEYISICINHLKAGAGDNVGGVWDIKPRNENWICRSIASAAGHPLGAGNAKYRIGSEAGLVDTVPFGSYKREMIKRIGGYDENLLSNEDYEFNSRIRSQGGKVFLDPAIRSTYFPRTSYKDLARQYWRYGFWKFKMLRSYPKTLLLRQALPPIFTLSLAILLTVSLFINLAKWLLIIEIAIYGLFIFLGAVKEAVKKKDAPLLFGFPLAIITMHIFWGTGFIWSALGRKSLKAN
jgi:succinoglycan biosynthesis protein ExoA